MADKKTKKRSISNSETKTVKNPCSIRHGVKVVANQFDKKYRELNKQCEETKYKEITKYFNKDKNTLKDLLVCLKNIYEEEKNTNPDFVMTLCGASRNASNPNIKSFIEDYFPRDQAIGNTNFKRQHVFEALCKLILLFDYDNGYYGEKDKKEFYNSLEKYTPTNKHIESKEQILNSGINVGNNAGVVDIFFSKSKSNKLPSSWACELNNLQKIHDDSDNTEFILVQNKYYTNEFSDVEKYDYSKILRKAKKLNSKDFNNFKIVLMVNNSKVLSEKINYEDETLEVLENDKLEEWFTNFLIDLDELSIDKFINPSIKRTTNTIQPRFHQELFIETTNEYLNKTGSDKRKKFIWGAVPRSGKSFMIAGMISKRAKSSFNDIILILGAKTETQAQFVDIFKTKRFIDFENYGVIYDGNLKEKKEKNIYIFSQEKFKANNENSLKPHEKELLKTLEKTKKTRNLDNEENLQYEELLNKSKKEYKIDSKVKELFKELFKQGNHVDIYFDEIHKGGSTEKSRQILKSFENENIFIDLFVMVTATFAKPNIAYEEFMAGYTPIVLEWNYEDQQLMKNIDTNEVNIDLIKYNRNKQNSNQDGSDNTEYEVINRLFDEYHYKYGENYKQILAKQYKHHPELVLINPETLDLKQNSFDFSSSDISDHFFELDCKAIDYTNKVQLKDYTSIFENSEHVNDLLNLIGSFDSQGLSNNCLYSILKDKTKFDYDCLNKPSTQLWFLPTNDLYNDSNCQPKYPESLKKKYRGGNEQTHTTNSDYESKQKDPKPHIEPLTRGVALALMNNQLFKKHFNVLIIHTNGELYKLSELDRSIINCVCVEDKNKSIVDKIKEYEIESYNRGKGVIILTGTILRLGVSLPCVDLAINFDNLSSVDLNYQTMFRVLTESLTNREKKYGYYVDLNKDRTIQFIYDYTQIYSNRLKTCKTIEDLADAQQNILQLFNFNGLTFRKQKIKEKLSLYSKMVSELKLDVETIRNKYMNNFQETIGKLILKINDIQDLNELNKQINIKFKNNSTKIKKDVEKGKKKQKAPKMPNEGDNSENPKNDNNNEEEENEEENEEVSQLEIQKNMKAFLPGIVFMLAYFSEEYKCTNLEQCLTNAIEEINKFEDTLCKCENTENFYLACYFDKFRNPKNKYKKDEFKKILVSLKQILFETDTYLTIRNSLIIFYDSIILSFNMNQLGGSNISSKKEYEPLIYKIYQKDTTQNKENFNKWIEETIYKFLPIRDEAKDKHGEVFTPRELIDEMMNKLKEIDSSVFKNKDLTWLDPANGVGNFPLIVYGVLMKSLKSSIPDEYERSQHILQKMLYMVELQTDNYEVSRKLFGKEANIFCGSFLSDDNKSINPDIAKKFGVEKYDIIMGNPPFQKSQEGKRKGGYGGRTLWDKFIKECLIKLNESGFLCFINPQSWRKPEHELWEEMTQKRQLHFIKILSESEGKRQFGADTKPDIYILQNKSIFKNTIIIDEKDKKHNLNLKELKFLPNYEYKNINKILTKINNGIDIIYSSSIYEPRKDYIKEKSSTIFKYPVVYKLNNSGVEYQYSSIDRGHFGIPKVIISSGRNTNPIFDDLGKYGMTQNVFGIPITSKKEGDLILKAINSPEFKNIIKATKWGTYQTDYRMFKYFKKDFWKEFVDEDGKPLKTSKLSSINSQNNSPNKSKKNNSTSTNKSKKSSNSSIQSVKTSKKNNSVSQSNKNKSKKKIKLVVVKKKSNSRQNISKNTKKTSATEKWSERKPDKFLRGYSPEYNKKDTKYINTLEKAKQISESLGNKSGGITQEGDKKYTIRKGKELKESKKGEVSWKKL